MSAEDADVSRDFGELFQAIVLDPDRVGAMLARGLDPNSHGKYTASLLHIAVGTGNTEVVWQLLQAGANEDCSYNHMCPLLHAATNDDLAMVRLPASHQVRCGVWRCRNHTHDSPVYMMSRNLVHAPVVRAGQAVQILSLLLAASGDYHALFSLPDQARFYTVHYNEPADELELCMRMAYKRRRVACSPAALEKAAFDLVRTHMLEVAMALAELDLPALLVVLVLEETCAPPGASLRMHHAWQLATKVKHFQHQ